MKEFKVNNRTIELYGEDKKDTTLILLHDEFHKGKEVLEECEKLGVSDFTLAGISGISWEDDLSPWYAPATFKKAPDFGGGADAYLEELVKDILPEILDKLAEKPKHIVMAGYSLAGLFALYSAYRTDCFDGVISASGSLWYPNFLAYAKEEKISEKVQIIYFSVGDKEAKTKNPVMQPVEENTRELAAWFKSKEIQTTFESNEGGHFKDDAKRLAKGIQWLLAEI